MTTLLRGTAVRFRQLAFCLSFVLPAAALWAADPTTADVTSPSAPGSSGPSPSDQTVHLEDYVVTGSSIKRVADEGALPMDIITPSEIDTKGITSVEQLVQDLNVNGNAMDNMASNGDVVNSGTSRGFNGASAANLRFQGSNATLVLLNGRRMAQHGLNGGGVVDLNSIPFLAIKRVEILKDGASSIYGTEAIGGVINFILRDDFQGLDVSSGMDVTQEGGGDIYKYSAIGGIGNLEKDHYNVMATLTYSDSRSLYGTQRSWINTQQPNRGLSADTRGTPYATLNGISSLKSVLSGASNSSFVDPSTGLSVSTVNTLVLQGPAALAGTGMYPYDWQLWSNPSAQYGATVDTGKVAAVMQPLRNYNLVTHGSYKIGETVLSLEGVFGRSDSFKSFSPSQLTSSTAATTSNPNGQTVANPLYNLAYPSTGADYNNVFNTLVAAFPQLAANRGLPMPIRWRFYPGGNREYSTRSDTWRGLASATGPLAFLEGWTYDAGISRAASSSSSTLIGGYYYTQGMATLIDNGTLDPFSFTQTPAAMAALAGYSASGVKLYSGTYTTDEANVSATGPIYKLPAGELQGAVGFDYIQDRYSLAGEMNPNLLTSAGLIANAPFDNANATNGALKRTVRAEFGELDIPIVHGVDFDPSVRSDLYSGFGRTTNPKYTARVAPLDWLLFRGSYSTGFRVPTFAQEYFPTTISPATANLVDPVTGQTINSYNVWTGGKLTLQPEKAKMDSLGVVLSPTKYLTFSADWWRIDRKNTIETLGVTTILQNYTLFPDRLIRDANGNLTAIDNTWLNAGETLTEGIEYQVHAFTEAAGGRLSLDFDLGDLLVKKSRLLPNVPYGASEVGVFPHGIYGELGIKYKTTTTLSYTHGRWGVSLTQVYRDGYKNQPEGNVFSGTYLPPDWPANVKSYTLYHLMFSYRDFFLKGLTMRAGVKNLFNTHPPFVTYYDTNSGAGSDWDPRVGDPRDRSFVASFEYKIF